MIIDKVKAKEAGVNVERLAYLDKFLTDAAHKMVSPAIAICAARGDTEVFSGAYGLASPDGPPLQLDMITEVQSVTKPFTATMIMMLQEDGLLDLADPLQKYFPEFSGPDKEGVCLWHLLAHVSGMSNQTTGEFLQDFIKTVLRDQAPGSDSTWEERSAAVDEVRRRMGYTDEELRAERSEDFLCKMKMLAPLDAKPNTRFDYCSFGYEVSRLLIEKISGEKMADFAARRLFTPLGMKDSHFVLPEEKWPRVLLRLESCRAGEWLNSEQDRITYSGSSGLKTTVPDLLRFGRMFLDKGTLDGARILSPATVRTMTRDHNPGIPQSFWIGRKFDSNWGLGWNIRCRKFDDMGVLRSANAYDHAGYGGARLLVDPDHALVAAYYIVDQPDEGHVLHGRVADILLSALD